MPALSFRRLVFRLILRRFSSRGGQNCIRVWFVYGYECGSGPGTRPTGGVHGDRDVRGGECVCGRGCDIHLVRRSRRDCMRARLYDDLGVRRIDRVRFVWSDQVFRHTALRPIPPYTKSRPSRRNRRRRCSTTYQRLKKSCLRPPRPHRTRFG